MAGSVVPDALQDRFGGLAKKRRGGIVAGERTGGFAKDGKPVGRRIGFAVRGVGRAFLQDEKGGGAGGGGIGRIAGDAEGACRDEGIGRIAAVEGAEGRAGNAFLPYGW